MGVLDSAEQGVLGSEHLDSVGQGVLGSEHLDLVPEQGVLGSEHLDLVPEHPDSVGHLGSLTLQDKGKWGV